MYGGGPWWWWWLLLLSLSQLLWLLGANVPSGDPNSSQPQLVINKTADSQAFDKLF